MTKTLTLFFLLLVQLVFSKLIPDITLHELQTKNCITPQKIFSEFSNKFILQKDSEIVINDLFEQPRSALLFSVNDAISSSDCNDGSSVTRLTNLLTGSTLKEHGVFGDYWVSSKGEKVKAYSSSKSWNKVENLASLFEKKFQNALTVSLSIDETFAKAGSVKDSFNKNNLIVYSKGGDFSVTFFGGKKNVLEFLSKNSLKGLSCDMKEHKCKIANAEYNLEETESFNYFAEIYMFFKALEYGKEKTSGNVPDFYTFASNSLKGLLEKYGVNSPVYANASKFLFDVVIPSIIEQANKIYENRVFSKVYSLGRSDRYKSKVYNVLKKFVKIDGMEDYFPNIYLPSTTELTNEKKMAICDSLKSIDEQLIVNCDTKKHFTIGRTVLSINSIFQSNNSSTNTTKDKDQETSLEIYDYQIFIWVAALILFCLILVIQGITSIDYSQDFLLYAFDEKVKKVK